jgi:hypothetical protein
MDEDLERLTREELIAEVRRLRRGIREHRESSGQELCWHPPALWGLLPERTDPLPEVPDRADFLQGCIRDRMSLDAQLPRAAGDARPSRSDGASTRPDAAGDARSSRLGAAARCVRPPRP